MKEVKVTIRIEPQTKADIDKAILNGKYETKSQLIRAALKEFLGNA